MNVAFLVMKQYTIMDQLHTVSLQIDELNMFFSYQIDHYGWSKECVTFAHLSEFDIQPYLKQSGIISQKGR